MIKVFNIIFFTSFLVLNLSELRNIPEIKIKTIVYKSRNYNVGTNNENIYINSKN